MSSDAGEMKKYQEELTRFVDSLYEGEKKVLVFGEGDIHAKIMMIGEAPGEQETLKQRPFVGKAGKNLDEFLELSGFKRPELFISNTVKFRPTKVSNAGRTVNRAPTTEEINLFFPWLEREISMVDPGCIVTLGNVPLKTLLGKKMTIGDVHGQMLELNGRKVYPLYHPASMIYNRALREVYTEDVMRLGRLFGKI